MKVYKKIMNGVAFVEKLILKCRYKDVYKIFRKEFGLKHQLLHAWRLELSDDEIVPPKYKNKIFEAPLPKEFAAIVKELGINENKVFR